MKHPIDILTEKLINALELSGDFDHIRITQILRENLVEVGVQVDMPIKEIAEANMNDTMQAYTEKVLDLCAHKVIFEMKKNKLVLGEFTQNAKAVTVAQKAWVLKLNQDAF